LYAAARESFPPIFAKRLGKSKEWYNETINKMTRIMFDMWASQGGRMSMDQLARLAKVKLGLFDESTEVNTEELVEKIVKRDDGKYEVMSKDGDRSFGVYGSEEKATKRLRQIEFFKHAKG